MATSFSVRADMSAMIKKQYQEILDGMTTEELVKEFISYLDYTEESDSGVEFHPIQIGSVRCLMSPPLGMVLQKLRGVGKK